MRTWRLFDGFVLAVITASSFALLSACGASAREDTVDSLTHDPVRLKTLLRQCKDAPGTVSEETCALASAAWRKRFFGENGQGGHGAPAAHGAPRS